MIISWWRNSRDWLGSDSQYVDFGPKLRDLNYILQTATATERGFVGNVRQRERAPGRKSDTEKEGAWCHLSVHACVICQRVCKAQWRMAVKFVEGVLAGPHADFLAQPWGRQSL